MAMANRSNSTVAIGTFEYRDKADAAVTALESAGFPYADIGVIAKRTSAWNDIDTARHVTGDPAAENAASGAVAGAAAGAGAGGLWALGIAAGVMPAIGPVIAGGILASVLASAAAGAAAGGIAGSLIGIGLTEEEANYYSDEVSSGRTVVTVRAGNRYDEAIAILRDHGAMLAASESRMTSPDIVGT